MKKFNQNDEFCPYCYTHSSFYKGGGSWSPDRCPNHPNSDDFILWKQMNPDQKITADSLFSKMWREKFDLL